MQLLEMHKEILQDIASFSSIERYRGMMPAKLALCFDEGRIDELVESGLIERIEISYACGQEATLLKLTEEGEQTLTALAEGDTETLARLRRKVEPEPPPHECVHLSKDQMQIISDVYHFSKISRFGGLMPQDEIAYYDQRAVNELFAQGFVIRVKAELGSGAKRKGLILSDKGLRCLRS